MASTYLTRTPSSAGNRRTYTFSGWFKRSNITNSNILFEARIDNDNRFDFRFGDNEKLLIYGEISNSNLVYLETSAVYRDPSAWYHVVVTVDTTQSTQSDRVKVYVNGEQITSFATSTNSLSLNQETPVNTTNVHSIGANTTGGGAYDGYAAHVHFTDGYAYAASTFGSTATNGQWVPNETPSVTYGTNGYFLKFTNASDLGEDSSGNNNDFTKSGSGDKTSDNPKNVFATLNPLAFGDNVGTLSEGNLNHTNSSGDSDAVSTMGISTGKFYAEFKAETVAGGRPAIAVYNDYDNGATNYGSINGSVLFLQDGRILVDNSSIGDFGSISQNDIIQVAVDNDNGAIYIGQNGTYLNSGIPTSGSSRTGSVSNFTAGSVSCFMGARAGSSSVVSANFGNPSFSITSGNADGNGKGTFEYAPPTGYLALCTDNLSSELTLPIGKGGSHMNTVLYTGNGSNGHAITGVGFQPDWVWLKSRSNTEGHWLGDSNRGANLRIQANTTGAEFDTTSNGYPGVSSFDSDGFTVGRSDAANGSGNSMVAWNWIAGGSSASNSDGSITSSVTVNTTAGFSVVTHTGTGSGSTTVGHGLGKVPAMIIVKDRGQVRGWNVYHQSIGNNSGVNLNSTGAQSGADSGWWNNTTPTSSVFTLGTYSNESSNYVSYCFAEIEGYSKIGKYTGNGSTDGAFAYTGFKPSWVLIKTSSDTDYWTIFDTTRKTFNIIDNRIHPNVSDAEYSGDGYGIDMLSNGFKQRSTAGAFNGSGRTYIYMAFAENPFATSGGVPVTAR